MSNNLLIITGGSQGIGHATVKHFLAQDWECINISRTPCPERACVNIACDLMDMDAIAALSLPDLSGYEKVALVHNAAMLTPDQAQQLSTDALQNTLTLNVLAPNALNQLIIPHLKPGASIVYIGSTLAEKAIPNCASYITSKHAIAGLMKATCQDLADTGIHTCCVCPGITDTKMLRDRVDNDPDILAALANVQTQKRMIAPDEIADVIWFCATHPVINGSVIHSNLGQRET